MPTQPGFTEFESILAASKSYTGSAFMLLLCWMVVADGRVAPEERALLANVGQSCGTALNIDTLLRLAQKPDLDALQLACEVIDTDLNSQAKRSLLQVMIGMALADGYLTVSENHLVRFFADFFGLSKAELNALFVEVSGKPLPSPSDPSTAAWWRSRTQSQSQGGSKASGKTESASSPSLERLRRLAILGLDESATAEDIKKAFRRMSQVHHPDRFANLGPEAQAAATESFKRIKQAYDELTNGHA